MAYVIDIPCMSGNAKAEQREAWVETTATGVRWHIDGKLAAAIHVMVRENGMTSEQRDIIMRAKHADMLARRDATLLADPPPTEGV